MNPIGLALIAVLAPLAAALVLLVVAPARRLGWPAALLSVLGALASTGASFALLAGQIGGAAAARWSVPWLPSAGASLAEVGVQVDGISAVMLSVVALVALCVQVFSLEYMDEEPPAGRGRYFAWQSLFLFSMQALVIAPNLLQLFLAWELVGLCSYLLIGFWYRRPSAARAAIKAFWVTKLADLGLILGLILQYTVAGSFAWDPGTASTLAGAGALTWVAGLYFVAVMGKSAQFPLHVWLPDAMEGPTPVSALLHAATMVAAGVYLLVRAWPLFAAAEAVLPVISVIGGVTALFAACVAVVQTDIKRVLAYSTISQLGYMIAALGAGGLFAGYFHLGTHAFFKALLFLAAGSVIHAVHSNEVDDMGGLRRTMPLTTLVFVIGAAALAGLPLLSGYFSKDAVLLSLQHATGASPVYWVPFVACVGTVFLTAFYMARVVFRAFFGEPATEAAATAHEGGWALAVPMLLLAVGSVGVGWGGGYMVVLAELHHEVHFDPLHVSAVGVIGTVLGLAGIAASWALDHRGLGQGIVAALAPLGRLARSGAVDRAWEGAYRRGLLALSAGVAWFDRYVVDGAVNATAALGLAAGERSRDLQTGRPRDYVLVVVLGVIVLAAWSQLQGGIGLSGVIW